MFSSHKKVGFLILIPVVIGIFCAGFFVGKHQVVCQVCKPEAVNFSLFWDAYAKLKADFIDPDKIDNQTLMYGAIEGMTHSLGDPYTDFFDPSHAKILQQDLAGSFEGIGVEVGIKKDQLTVIAPLKGSPGEKAGLVAGDIILKINDVTTVDMAVDRAVSLIRGKKGTAVTIKVFREGWEQPKDITIIRDTIKIDSITWELKEGNIAYIHMNQFNQSLSDDFVKVAHEILSSPAQKIVLDLRNNPGGYLEVCQNIASWFLKDKQIVTIEDFGKGKERKEYTVEGNGAFSDYPLVILINGGSASASEILAGALRDNRAIKLIGEKSFGKGSVQEVVSLQDNKSFLKITIAKWLTPKGYSISEAGLVPDVKVKALESDTESKNDVQLNKALEIIKALD